VAESVHQSFERIGRIDESKINGLTIIHLLDICYRDMRFYEFISCRQLVASVLA